MKDLKITQIPPERVLWGPNSSSDVLVQPVCKSYTFLLVHRTKLSESADRLPQSPLRMPAFVSSLDGRGRKPWFWAWLSWSNDFNNIAAPLRGSQDGGRFAGRESDMVLLYLWLILSLFVNLMCLRPSHPQQFHFSLHLKCFRSVMLHLWFSL